MESDNLKHVLVGGGYIASNLVKSLKKSLPKDIIHVIGLDEPIFFDINNSKEYPRWSEFFENATVYIFASISSDSLVREHPKLAIDTNIVGLANFFSFLLKECNPKKVIFTSSEWVYDERSNNSLVGLGDEVSSYSQQKLCGEFIADQHRRAYETPILVVRFGIVWGRRETGGACESIAKQCFEASKLKNPVITVGNTQNARRFVHIDDLSFALSKISGEPGGIYDLTGSEIVSIGDIVKMCGDILDTEILISESDKTFSRRVLAKSDIKPVSYTWQKVSFEDRLREHINEFFL